LSPLKTKSNEHGKLGFMEGAPRFSLSIRREEWMKVKGALTISE
jgi:hypothetical protein